MVTDIALLQGLCKKIPGCKFFEIGTWRGETVANVSNYAAECYTLNLSKNELIQSGATEAYANQQGFFSNRKKIIHLEGNSMSYDFSALNKKFDVIFIDGDHRYEFVRNDSEKIFENLVHDNSIVVWHDYGYNPCSTRHEVMAAIMDGTPKKFHQNLYHVSNTLCAIFTKEKLNAHKAFADVVPDKVFKVEVSVKNRQTKTHG